MHEEGDTERTIIVTGGAGFIGSAVVRRLVADGRDRVVTLDALTYAGHRENLAEVATVPRHRFVQLDIRDADAVADLFEEARPDAVMHLAAESHVDRSILDPLAFVRTNVVGTATLLEAARTAWSGDGFDPMRHRFYHVSTDEVFGSLGPDGYFTEETPYAPRSPYSASKAGSDHLVQAYHHTYGLPTVLSNCSNNYGPFQFPEKLIPLTIQNALHERPVPIYGQGENVRDWLFVDDHCDAIDVVLRHGRTGASYLVSGNNEWSNRDLVRFILGLVDEALERAPGTSQRLVTFVKDRPGHDYRYALDAARLRRELDWAPTHGLEDGLRRTVRWYLEHRDWLQAVSDESYRAYYDRQYADRLDS